MMMMMMMIPQNAAPSTAPLQTRLAPLLSAGHEVEGRLPGLFSREKNDDRRNIKHDVDANLAHLTHPETIRDPGGWYVATRSVNQQLNNRSHTNPLIAATWLETS